MINIYKALYYRFYSLLGRIHSDPSEPEYLAVMAVATVTFINLTSIPILIHSISGWQIIDLMELFNIAHRFYWIAFILVYFSIHFLIFWPNRRYKSIIKEFESEPEIKRKEGHRNIILYVALSFVVFFASVIISHVRMIGAI